MEIGACWGGRVNKGFIEAASESKNCCDNPIHSTALSRKGLACSPPISPTSQTIRPRANSELQEFPKEFGPHLTSLHPTPSTDGHFLTFSSSGAEPQLTHLSWTESN